MSFEELTPLHAAAQLGHEEAPKKAKAVAPRRGDIFGRAQKAASCPLELEVIFCTGSLFKFIFTIDLIAEKNCIPVFFLQCSRGW